jgi:hypothetical protein
MVEWTATVGGTNVDGVVTVDYGGENEGKLGVAEIECKNVSTNRNFSYGDEVLIFRDGSEDFEGLLTGKPAGGTRNLTVVLKARDKRSGLHDSEVHRPFYDMDSGAAIREAVEKQTSPRDPRPLFVGNDLSAFSSDVPIMEKADLPEQELQERGKDLVFLYWKEGEGGTYEVTFDDVPLSVDDGTLLWFETRYLFNNRGDFFSVEVELRDHAGNNYVWDLSLGGVNEPKKERLNAETADPNGELTSDGTLQYRIDIDGALPEPRAAVLDFARVRAFALQNRGTSLSTGGVQNTGRDIVRRFDSSIMEMISGLSTEDGATSFVEDDVLYYEPAGDTNAPVDIDEATTRVLSVDVDRSSADIVNKVVAQGAGDLQKEYRSSSSIEFYGRGVPKEEPLVDNQIQNEDELDDLAKGYLSENAWEDTAASFTVVGPDFQNVRVGQAINVSWTPDAISGTFVVSSVESDDAGRITIGITGHIG